MTDTLRVTLEIGAKGKRVVAVAPDWPGLEHAAKTEEAAVARVQAYLPRYAPVATLAAMGTEFAARVAVEMVERDRGTGSTDYWGVSFACSDIDRAGVSRAELERELTLLQACWVFFDEVRAQVSTELQKGPRGGGRDRDRIVRHTLGAQQDMAAKLGLRTPDGAFDAGLLTDEGLSAHRDRYCTTIRAFHTQGQLARTWPLRYLIRHTASHTLDHAWEMQDKDLTNSRV